MSACTQTATAELERLSSRSRALRRRAQAPDLPQTVARPNGSVRLLTLSRSAPGAVIKVARRTALHVLWHDADRTVCMAVELRIAGNVLGVECVPSR
eukprot:5299488-Prymnesium_polylepis.1